MLGRTRSSGCRPTPRSRSRSPDSRSTTSASGRSGRRRRKRGGRRSGWSWCPMLPRTRRAPSRDRRHRPANAGEVVAAGARRLCAVRAIRDAEDPVAAAEAIRRAFATAEGAAPSSQDALLNQPAPCRGRGAGWLQERRKRKQRGAKRMGAATPGPRTATSRPAKPGAAGRGERPRVVTVGAIVAGFIALSIVGGYVAGVQVTARRSRRGSRPRADDGTIAWGTGARYWPCSASS